MPQAPPSSRPRPTVCAMVELHLRADRRGRPLRADRRPTPRLPPKIARYEHGFIVTGTDLSRGDAPSSSAVSTVALMFETTVPGVFAVGASARARSRESHRRWVRVRSFIQQIHQHLEAKQRPPGTASRVRQAERLNLTARVGSRLDSVPQSQAPHLRSADPLDGRPHQTVRRVRDS
jgi:hypothetical protein